MATITIFLIVQFCTTKKDHTWRHYCLLDIITLVTMVTCNRFFKISFQFSKWIKMFYHKEKSKFKNKKKFAYYMHTYITIIYMHS